MDTVAATYLCGHFFPFQLQSKVRLVVIVFNNVHLMICFMCILNKKIMWSILATVFAFDWHKHNMKNDQQEYHL